MEILGHIPESHTDHNVIESHEPPVISSEVSSDEHTIPKELSLRESIVGPAWNLVMNTSFIKKFNFFPSLLSTIYLGCIILYQLAFTYVNIFQLKDQFFAVIIQWVHAAYFWQFIGALVIGVLLYIFITPIAE